MDLKPHSKFCKPCGEFVPRILFYETPYSKSGLSSYCKKHSNEKGKEYRQKRLAHYREYDRKRDKTKARLATRKTRNDRYKERFPERVKARNDLNKAIVKGLITKGENCKCCGFSSSNLHGHHYDYSKPLEVIWLCNDCHEEIHHA